MREALHESIAENLQGKARAIANQFGVMSVSGDQWLCYIRCVLAGLNKSDLIGTVQEILEQESELYNRITTAGIEIGTIEEERVQAVIQMLTGINYHVVALTGNQMAQGTGAGNGVCLILLHTGAHFSLVQGPGKEIMQLITAAESGRIPAGPDDEHPE